MYPPNFGDLWSFGTKEQLCFGSLHSNYAGWVLEGEKTQAQHTRKWKGVTGPVIIMGKGDTMDTLILDKIVAGPLHCYLAANEVINFAEKTCLPEVKGLLKTVAGVQTHEYQGKVGNYEGPSIRKIFRKLEELQTHLQVNNQDQQLFIDTLVSFRQVSQSCFGTRLHPLWREHLGKFRSCIQQMATLQGMAITPKLHVICVHVEQWIDRHGRAMGMEGEAGGEAMHHVWKRLIEGQGAVKDKTSEAYETATMMCLNRLNANNV